MMKGIILAGRVGIRRYPSTMVTSKPLLPIARLTSLLTWQDAVGRYLKELK